VYEVSTEGDMGRDLTARGDLPRGNDRDVVAQAFATEGIVNCDESVD